MFFGLLADRNSYISIKYKKDILSNLSNAVGTSLSGFDRSIRVNFVDESGIVSEKGKSLNFLLESIVDGTFQVHRLLLRKDVQVINALADIRNTFEQNKKNTGWFYEGCHEEAQDKKGIKMLHQLYNDVASPNTIYKFETYKSDYGGNIAIRLMSLSAACISLIEKEELRVREEKDKGEIGNEGCNLPKSILRLDKREGEQRQQKEVRFADSAEQKESRVVVSSSLNKGEKSKSINE